MRTASESPITLSGNSLIASRQGTMHFMSIEVAAHRFLFTPSVPKPSLADFDKIFGAMKQNVGTTQTKVSFSHNHLHDLESLWWVTVWVAFYNYFSEATPSRDRPSFTLRDAKGQLEQARILFPPTLESTTRHYGFQNAESFKATCEKLPPNKRATYLSLDILRVVLISHYSVVEAKCPLSVDPKSSEDDIYDDFTRVFSNLKTVSQDLVLDSIPGIYEKLLKSKGDDLKRPRSESTSVAEVAPKTARK